LIINSMTLKGVHVISNFVLVPWMKHIRIEIKF